MAGHNFSAFGGRALVAVSLVIVACGGQPATMPLAAQNSHEGDSASSDELQSETTARAKARRMLETEIRQRVDAYWPSTREDLARDPDTAPSARYERMWDAPVDVLLEWMTQSNHPGLHREAVVVLCLEHWSQETAAAVVRIARAPKDEYQGLNAALCLSLRGRQEAVPILLRVLPPDPSQPHYAMSNSGMEVGLAALGLAVLDSCEHVSTLRRYQGAVNVARWMEISIRALEAEE